MPRYVNRSFNSDQSLARRPKDEPIDGVTDSFRSTWEPHRSLGNRRPVLILRDDREDGDLDPNDGWAA